MENPAWADQAVLLERINKLERRTRRLWFALLSLAAVTLGGLAAGVKAASKPLPVVEASWFVLKASDTEVRAELIVDPKDGAGKLRLYGSNGGLTMELPARQELFPLGATSRPSE